ncbi:MAG TPA: M20/M25/M40 family metallo-hydrolase [Nitriliruptorales bacterium]|nr:M20/M25/M40 family metallo-hydrolase [Nitriliruptorales bacterium]
MPDRTWPDHLDDVAQAVLARDEERLAALGDLVRIPSVSADGHDPAQVRRSADLTARLLRGAGLEDVRLLEVDGAHPYVYGEWRRAVELGPGDRRVASTTSLANPGDDAVTVLLYAHHDVQPVGTPDRWHSPPFEPTVRDGRLYGRGTADDKAGILVHVAAVRAWLDARGGLPVDVKVVIEGEEEIGSPHLGEFLRRHADTLRADVIVLTDATNWKVGVPALTYSLRGLAEVYVTVRALEQPIHSGMWGGPIPDALTGLLKALATLTDERGRPAVAGLFDDVRPVTDDERKRLDALDADPVQLRTEARVLPGVEWTGDPERSVLERIWMQPTVTVIGMDVPSLREASNTLLAEASAKVSIRLAPGQSPGRAAALVEQHLHDNVPFNLHVETHPGHGGQPWVTDPRGPAFEAGIAALRSAFGTEPALIGCGGSIPFVVPFSQAFGGAPCLLTGIEDPSTNAHGEDESLHLGDFSRACLAETVLLEELAARAGAIRAGEEGGPVGDGAPSGN